MHRVRSSRSPKCQSPFVGLSYLCILPWGLGPANFRLGVEESEAVAAALCRCVCDCGQAFSRAPAERGGYSAHRHVTLHLEFVNTYLILRALLLKRFKPWLALRSCQPRLEIDRCPRLLRSSGREGSEIIVYCCGWPIGCHWLMPSTPPLVLLSAVVWSSVTLMLATCMSA